MNNHLELPVIQSAFKIEYSFDALYASKIVQNATQMQQFLSWSTLSTAMSV